MQIGASATVTITKATDFIKRQRRDWYVTVTRSSLERFAYQMVVPYLSHLGIHGYRFCFNASGVRDTFWQVG